MDTSVEAWCTGHINLVETKDVYEAVSASLLLPHAQKQRVSASFSTTSSSEPQRSTLALEYETKTHCHQLMKEHQQGWKKDRNQSQLVYNARGIRIYTTDSFQSSNQRPDLKRYTAYFDIAATIQELASFFIPTESQRDRVQQCRDLLFPDVYGSTTLWTSPISTSQTRIQWMAYRMSTLFTRDRDMIVLEHYQTLGSQSFIHLLHSVDAPQYDPSLLHHAKKRYVRASLHTSGLVATQVSNRHLQISITLDMDLHDTVTQIGMIKRLQQWIEIREIVWKAQMIHDAHLFTSRQAMTVGETLTPCEVCTEFVLSNTTWSTTHMLDGTVANAKTLCHCCDRLVCGSPECTKQVEFPLFLVHEIIQKQGKKYKKKSPIVTLCQLCVKEYRQPV